ncbi:endonuclease III, partial [Myxococcota bacterium]|nr:endonuclease III [Myxococcota bacterium]
SEWIGISHRLIAHGRKVCVARNPRCHDCPLVPYCPQGNHHLVSP